MHFDGIRVCRINNKKKTFNVRIKNFTSTWVQVVAFPPPPHCAFVMYITISKALLKLNAIISQSQKSVEKHSNSLIVLVKNLTEECCIVKIREPYKKGNLDFKEGGWGSEFVFVLQVSKIVLSYPSYLSSSANKKVKCSNSPKKCV